MTLDTIRSRVRGDVAWPLHTQAARLVAGVGTALAAIPSSLNRWCFHTRLHMSSPSGRHPIPVPHTAIAHSFAARPPSTALSTAGERSSANIQCPPQGLPVPPPALKICEPLPPHLNSPHRHALALRLRGFGRGGPWCAEPQGLQSQQP